MNAQSILERLNEIKDEVNVIEVIIQTTPDINSEQFSEVLREQFFRIDDACVILDNSAKVLDELVANPATENFCDNN